MTKSVSPVVLDFVKQVDTAIAGRTGVRLVDLQTDLKALPNSLGDVQRAFKESTPPDDYALELASAFGMDPVERFASRDEAKAVNKRRAALATLSSEDPDWVRGGTGHKGALLKEGDQGVIRLSVVSSRDGAWGFGVHEAQGARIVEGVDGWTVEPAGADFSFASSGPDIKDAVEAYEREFAASTAPTI